MDRMGDYGSLDTCSSQVGVSKNGRVAEGLGVGLQNRSHRFKSCHDLLKWARSRRQGVSLALRMIGFDSPCVHEMFGAVAQFG